MNDEFYIYMEEKLECFSNNVVIRLFMQEFFILIFVFIVGLGEVNYWGELKQVFLLMGFVMILVVLRLNIMIFECYIEKKFLEWNILFQEVIEYGIGYLKDIYFEKQILEEFFIVMEQVKLQIEVVYKSVRNEVFKVDLSFELFLQKNVVFI